MKANINKTQNKPCILKRIHKSNTDTALIDNETKQSRLLRLNTDPKNNIDIRRKQTMILTDELSQDILQIVWDTQERNTFLPFQETTRGISLCFCLRQL